MYLYLTILGIFFITLSSIVINFIDTIFPSNKISYYLNPNKKTAFNRTNTTILPIIIWNFISIPILGNNKLFLVSIITNIFVSCCIMYVIKYAMIVIFNKENPVVDIISIIISTIFGSITSYIILLINSSTQNYIKYSAIGLVIILVLYLIIKKYNPKSDFFTKEMY